MKKVRSLLLPIYLIMNVLYIFIGTYLVQAMFNIGVIEIAPFFYMTLGFLVDRK